MKLTGERLQQEKLDIALLREIRNMFSKPYYQDTVKKNNNVLYHMLGSLCDIDYYEEITRYSVDVYEEITHHALHPVRLDIQNKQIHELARLLNQFKETKDEPTKTLQEFRESLENYQHYYINRELDIKFGKKIKKKYRLDSDNFFVFSDKHDLEIFMHEVRQVNRGGKHTIFDELYRSIMKSTEHMIELTLGMSFSYMDGQRFIYVELVGPEGEDSVYLSKRKLISVHVLKQLIDAVVDKDTPYDQALISTDDFSNTCYDPDEDED